MHLDLTHWEQGLGILLAAAAAAWMVFILVSSLRIESLVERRLRKNRSGKPQENGQAEIGVRISGMLPISPAKWENHLVWAQRGGYYQKQKLGGIVITACLYAGGSLMVVLIKPAPVFFLLPVLAFCFPLIAMRSKANAVRKKAVRGLPEMASLVAAEISAGTPLEQAIQRAAGLPGLRSGLLG